MSIQITNSLTRKKELFVPLEKGVVKMYVCGPTVYGLTHVGNARPVVFFDVVRRYLERTGYKVKFVSNFTDVDDKIINKAREEKTSAAAIAEKYTAEFIQDRESMGVKSPTICPKVTESIPQIIEVIQGLIDRGFAYALPDGEVLYSVRKFDGYGKLSGKNIDELLVGARVAADEKKRDPLDFSLWKPRKSDDEPSWDSPWGQGRPGWHIECSAMAWQHLGETFDIHGGGMDLMHPHHENEIAQSEAFTGKPMVRYWMHNNLLTFGNEKMSKSLGNIFLNRDFIAKYGSETLRFLHLSGHYRSPIEFNEKHIREIQAALHRVYSALRKAGQVSRMSRGSGSTTSAEDVAADSIGATFEARWAEAMDDDFNTAKVIGFIFEYVRAINAALDRKGFRPTETSLKVAKRFLNQMHDVGSTLNLFQRDPGAQLAELRDGVLAERGIHPDAIKQRVAARTEARLKKDFAASDAIRDELLAQGIVLRDGPHGTDWDISFSDS